MKTNKKCINHPYIVFAGEHYNPLGIIRSLGEEGYPVDAIIVKGSQKIASKSKYITKLHLVNSIEEGYQLLQKEYGGGNGKNNPFILTADDRITGYLDVHFEELKDSFFFFNAKEAGRITYYMDKNHINQLAIKHGLNVLKTYVVEKGDIPEDIVYPVITKAISSNSGAWKKDVFICNSERELKEAYTKIKGTTILLQKYMEKKNELCLDGCSFDKGNQVFISIASNYNYLLPNTYSSYMKVYNFYNPALENSLNEMFKEIGYEGIFSVEFLIGEDETLYFLEVNFRNSTWSYASTCAGMNLPVLWSKSMINKKLPADCYQKIPGDFNAMVELSDFKERVLAQKIGLFKWIGEMRKCNCLFYYNKKDQRPFWSSILSRLVR